MDYLINIPIEQLQEAMETLREIGINLSPKEMIIDFPRENIEPLAQVWLGRELRETVPLLNQTLRAAGYEPTLRENVSSMSFPQIEEMISLVAACFIKKEGNKFQCRVTREDWQQFAQNYSVVQEDNYHRPGEGNEQTDRLETFHQRSQQRSQQRSEERNQQRNQPR